tara:strand:- start:655 stop:1455 length:801 start_codon:yes stop_codon:yes gene_type:complete
MKRHLNLIHAFSRINYEKLKDKLKLKNVNVNISDKKILDEISNTGISIIPNYYSDELCNQIIDDLEEIIKDNKVNVWKDKWGADNRVYASQKYSELINNYHNDQYLFKLAEAYLKAPVINSHTLGAKLITEEENLGSGGGWHRDSVYRIQFKSILYLNDVEYNNGPFEYIIGTHKKKSVYSSILKNNFKSHQNRISENQIEDFIVKNKVYQKRIFTAKKGTLILVDTSGIHRGMPIIEGTRYALTNYFFPKHHYSMKSKSVFEKLF